MMNIAEWILVIMLAVTLLIFLIVAIALIIKLMHVADEINKVVMTGQGIAAKADDIVDNVKGMTSVGGIVKTFSKHVINNQERRYAEEEAMREEEIRRAVEEAEAEARAEAIKKVYKNKNGRTTRRATKDKDVSKK